MRRQGFYWVRTELHRPPEVAEWDGDAWYLCGYDLPAEVIQVLSETPLTPPD